MAWMVALFILIVACMSALVALGLCELFGWPSLVDEDLSQKRDRRTRELAWRLDGEVNAHDAARRSTIDKLREGKIDGWSDPHA